MNKKKIIIITLVLLFLLLIATIFIIVLNNQYKVNDNSYENLNIDPISDETSEQDIDTFDDLSECISFVDLSVLPRDNTDYHSYDTYFVSADGNDNSNGTKDMPFSSISHALEIAGDNSIIFVREGTYKTNILRITHSNFILTAYENETVNITPLVKNIDWNMEEDLAILIEGDISDVVIDGITMMDFEEGIVYGDPETQENITFKNIDIKGASIGIQNTYLSHTDYLVKNLLIKNVTMNDISGIGVQCGDEQQLCAQNVLIQNVSINGSPDNVNDTGYDSLAFVNSDNLLVIDSVFTYAPGDGLDFKSTRVSVVNTVVGNPNRNGIKFWHEGEIINSIVYATGADAAIVFDSEKVDSRFRLINSIAAQHLISTPISERYAYAMTIGYDQPDSFNIELINNIFYDMPGPIYINPQSSVIIHNNIFYNFIHDDRFLVYGEDDFNDTEMLNSRNYANDNNYIDPEFQNPTSADWLLQETSPAIDAGSRGENIPLFDINWEDRPIGNEIDIGPYEE